MKNKEQEKKESQDASTETRKAEPFFLRSHPHHLDLDPLDGTKKNPFKPINNSPASGPNRARILAEIREENDWKTDFVLGKRAGAALR